MPLALPVVTALDWHGIFAVTTPLGEIFLRGTTVYFFIFFALRLVLKRQTGQLAINDLLVLVLIADAAQNAMAGTYTSVSDGLLLVATIIGWAWFIDWISYRFPWAERLFKPRPKRLVHDGELSADTMRREFLTLEELATQLRLQGVEDLAKVKNAYVEPDGRISVIMRDDAGGSNGAPDRPIS
jgi:uncharacterized membrane protein YcaP (DUF421 family)